MPSLGSQLCSKLDGSRGSPAVMLFVTAVVWCFLGSSTLLAAGQAYQQEHHSFDPPAGIDLFELGKKKNWNTLQEMLTPFDNFYVTNNETLQHLKAIQKRIDESGSSWFFWTALHNMVSMYGGDNGELMQKLLALGVHPDETDGLGERPSHIASWFGRVESARALVLCRVDLKAECRQHDHTPVGEAGREDDVETRASQANINITEFKELRNGVKQVWLEAEKNGTVLVAELASRGDWWAVKNLFRRGAVPASEAFAEYRGKTAEEWAESHGEVGLAAELRYFQSQLATMGPEVRQALFLLKEDMEGRLQRVQTTGDYLRAEVAEIRTAVASLQSLMARHLLSSSVRSDPVLEEPAENSGAGSLLA